MEFLPQLVLILQVVLGIGLVIFVHELGHFLAARLCGVRVETFSIGMGPRLFGWKRGHTTYQVAALPLGGYVRWAGEEWRPEDGPADPDLFAAKSVGQRFFMYSGGVLMNVAFGLVVFPILFWNGVNFVRPAIGDVAPGSPAWQARVPSGAEVVSVDGKDVYEFTHLLAAVALGDPDQTELVLRDPSSGALRTYELQPFSGGVNGFPVIGVSAPIARDADGHPIVQIADGGPAWRAGLRSGDRLLGFEDALPGIGLLEQYRELLVEDRPLVLRVDGEAGPRTVTLVPEEQSGIPANKQPKRVGVRPPHRSILAVRQGITLPIALEEGDRLLSINGQRILRLGDFQRAISELEGPLAIALERPLAGAELEEDGLPHRFVPRLLDAPALDAEARRTLLENVATDLDLASGVVVATEGLAAFAEGLRDGDQVLAVDGQPTASWADIIKTVELAARESRAARFEVQRTDAQGVPAMLEFQIEPQSVAPRWDGVDFPMDEYRFRTQGVLGSLRAGAVFSWRFLQDTWLTLKRMLLGSIDPRDALGGPVSIASISYRVAESGLSKLFFFLCILSINLAFLNVLPIPVLDGGHLFFLLVEKIKGSPVSDRVLGYSQMVGVALILGLLVFVTYNDLARWVFNG